MRTGAFVFLGMLLLATPTLADNAVHGRIELEDSFATSRDGTLDTFLGAPDRNDFLADGRLIWEPNWGNWNAAVHYEAAYAYGDGVALARRERFLSSGTPPLTMFDLTDTLANSGNTLAVQRIDRLSIGYSATDFVVRVGRQALTWGSGMVFRPMDLFAPFAPDATDTEYKSGTDMLYTQFLFEDGSDLQIIAVPRPEQEHRAPTADASSFAAHYHADLLGHPLTLLLARDHGDWVGAAGIGGQLGGASWNVEVVPTFVHGGPTDVSGVANISDAVTVFDRNATIFAEYFHNGFGVSSRQFALALLPPELTDRLSRGQVFNLRRNYLAAGMTLEVTPLLTVTSTLIAGLDDRSFYPLFAATYSLDDNLTLIAGAQAPIGPRDTEYGGIPLSPGNPLTVAPPAQLYLQIRQYF